MYLDKENDVNTTKVIPSLAEHFTKTSVVPQTYTVSKDTLYTTVTFTQTATGEGGHVDTCTWQYYIKREYFKIYSNIYFVSATVRMGGISWCTLYLIVAAFVIVAAPKL